MRGAPPSYWSPACRPYPLILHSSFPLIEVSSLPRLDAAVGGIVEEEVATRLKALLIELIIYGLLVTVYVLLVLRYLSGWLKHLYDDGKTRYAIVCLLLIIGQGVTLEMVTGALLRLLRTKAD